MEVEIEFEAKGNDRIEILTKLIDLIKVAEQQGLVVKEIELEEEEEE